MRECVYVCLWERVCVYECVCEWVIRVLYCVWVCVRVIMFVFFFQLQHSGWRGRGRGTARCRTANGQVTCNATRSHNLNWDVWMMRFVPKCTKFLFDPFYYSTYIHKYIHIYIKISYLRYTFIHTYIRVFQLKLENCMALGCSLWPLVAISSYAIGQACRPGYRSISMHSCFF